MDASSIVPDSGMGRSRVGMVNPRAVGRGRDDFGGARLDDRGRETRPSGRLRCGCRLQTDALSMPVDLIA